MSFESTTAAHPSRLRALVVVPGGIGSPRAGETIPALHDFVTALAERCNVAVLTLGDEREPCSVRSPVPVFNPGRRARRWASAGRIDPVLRVLRAERVAFDVVHSFWLGSPSRVARALSRATGAAWIAGVGGQELCAVRRVGLGSFSAWREHCEIRTALAAAAVVTAGSLFVLRQLRARGVDGVWLPLFPDRARFRPEARVSVRRQRPFRLVTIADHNAAKAPSTLLRLVAELVARGHDVHLDWLGRELVPGASARAARALGVESAVTIHGHVPHTCISAFLTGADVYVQSSRYESQGVAVCEAAACGVPLVGTDVGILAEMAPDHAFAAPVGGAEALADLVEELIRDPQRCEAMGRAALAWIGDYSHQWSVTRALELYAVALGTGRQCE